MNGEFEEAGNENYQHAFVVRRPFFDAVFPDVQRLQRAVLTQSAQANAVETLMRERSSYSLTLRNQTDRLQLAQVIKGGT